MAWHNITSTARKLDAATLASLEKDHVIRIEDDVIYATGRREQSQVEALVAEVEAQKIEVAEKAEGVAAGTWRKSGAEWLVRIEGGVDVGQQVRVTRRDGSSGLYWIEAFTAEGLARVTQTPPAVASEIHTVVEVSRHGGSRDGQVRIVRGAEWVVIRTEHVTIDEDMPSIYGAHLLGCEGGRGVRLTLAPRGA